ncbi:MAG TPA: neutral zinc metallopeptidase [Bacteroidia bacterium]|nr:neutral zinc metallopeptidase [Bacteroidia bacterium]
MKWRGRKESTNVDDRRGRGINKGAGLGLGGIVLVLVVWLMGGNPMQMLQQVQQQNQVTNSEYQPSAEEEELASFVKVVLQDTEDIWHKLFQEQLGQSYEEPTLVLFSGGVQSACGQASSASGPFYCPGDHQVYIDLSFYKMLKDRFNAPGDFAMAYVVAHEVGHHIQNLLGISRQVQSQRSSLSEVEYNKLSVKLELQADFLAGVWAHYAQNYKGVLEPGDIEEALRAANAIGDDQLQKQAQGHVVPDAFTHGTSEQRMRWFTKGFQSGNLNMGDTFSATEL